METLCFKLGRCRLAYYCWLDSKITLWIAVERVIIWSKDWSCSTIWGGMQKQRHHRLPKTGTGLKGFDEWTTSAYHILLWIQRKCKKVLNDWQHVNRMDVVCLSRNCPIMHCEAGTSIWLIYATFGVKKQEPSHNYGTLSTARQIRRPETERIQQSMTKSY